jgi:hypothetical protein
MSVQIWENARIASGGIVSTVKVTRAADEGDVYGLRQMRRDAYEQAPRIRE